MSRLLIKNALVINEGTIKELDVLINGKFIERIGGSISDETAEVIDIEGKYLMPGCIDDQVHFREPGLTHKANIATESAAAAAGGITSFMEMPNTVPNTLTQELLEDKYEIAAQSSFVNYSFFMGASNDNLEEVLKTDPSKVCGIKVFMGSSTGNMLVDNAKTLEGLFSKVEMLIATHCEDEATIRQNLEKAKELFGEEIPMHLHPVIRSEEACYLSSSMAVDLAKKHDTRLHILHISTEKELDLFRNDIPLTEKKITAEACVHHLWFSDEDYDKKGAFIKWNPAVKKATDRNAIWQAVLDNRIDVIATDHAPHTLEEKQNSYLKAPSGGPLVQHALLAVLEKHQQGIIPLVRVVEKMAHAPAELFRIEKRGFIREGYFADLVIVDPNEKTSVRDENILYKCGWSPFDGHTFSHKIDTTIINGQVIYSQGRIKDKNGMRLTFSLR